MPIVPARKYWVAIMLASLEGMNANAALIRFGQAAKANHALPEADSCVPVKIALAEYGVRTMIKKMGALCDIVGHSGKYASQADIHAKLTEDYGSDVAQANIATVMATLDYNKDGKVGPMEWLAMNIRSLLCHTDEARAKLDTAEVHFDHGVESVILKSSLRAWATTCLGADILRQDRTLEQFYSLIGDDARGDSVPIAALHKFNTRQIETIYRSKTSLRKSFG